MYNKQLKVAPMEGEDLIDTGKNWLEYKKLLEATKREGVKELLTILEKTDFATAPASHNHHLAVKGGLCQHSLNVNKYAHELTKMVGVEIKPDYLTVSALLHDLCKIHYYKVSNELDKEHKEKTGEW